MKAAVQVLKKAEELKQKVTGDIVNDNDAWNNHQKLQDLYQQLLVIDLEYALDKKVEQDLWNYVFKNQINTLQMQAKDRKNPQRSESQESLIWFLEAASGFYLQFLQELCETFNLDIPCRRKGSVYGIAGETKPLATDIVPPHNSSCLYICQHCLVHLGDIARYRNQSLQAETFYRHAAELVPSNGQPYNQLAILEAAKGDKLSTVFYYVRSTAVKYPFPVAATNLQKMFSKIANDEFQHEGKTKLSVYDYVTAFLQFHALVHLTSDLDKAQKLGRVLSANLTILIATESLTAWKLIQMTAINMFSITHSTRGLELLTSEKKEQSEPEALSEDEQTAYNLVLELIASTLNGMLLLVYTMKEDSDLKSYYVLPVIKLILEWLRQDPSHLKAASFTGKLQIWPSFCKLLNAIQSTQISGFDINKYVDVPLPEDWDLQSFLPLYKAYRSYKFKEPSQHLTNEEEHTLRAVRIITLGHWLCEQEIYGVKLMMVQPSKEGKGFYFEAITPQTPSTDVLKQLEEMSLGRNSVTPMTISISEPNGHQNESINGKLINGDHHSNGSTASSSGSPPSLADDTSENDPSFVKSRGIRGGGKLQHVTSENPSFGNKNSASGKENQNRGCSGIGNSAGRERKMRQNVALQTIMQKKNMVIKNDVIDDHSSGIKLKSEGKQVTFKTPSPSPPASSSGTPPLPQQATSSPSIFNTDLTSCFSPLRSPPYPLQQQQQKMKSYNGSHPHSDPNSNLILEPMLGAVSNPTSQPRIMYSGLPNTDLNYSPSINPSTSNKFSYFGNGEVHSLPGQSMSPQNNDGGNNANVQQNSRLGVLGSSASLNGRPPPPTNGPANIVSVPQAQPGFMFGFSQSQQSNVSQPSSQISQATSQNRLPINPAAVAAAVAAQKPPPPPPPYMNPALFGQSSQPPQWFPQQQNAIGMSAQPVKSSNFDQIFSHLNRPQVPPPPPSLHQGFPNSLMSNQPFGPSQRPRLPAPQDGNPYLYQMMRQMPDQLAFPSFPPSFMSQQPTLSNNLQQHPPQSVSTNFGHVPNAASQSRLNNNMGIGDIAMENHQQPNNYDGFPHLGGGGGGSLSRLHHDGQHGPNMQMMPSMDNSTSGQYLAGLGAVKSGHRAENGTGPLTSTENAPSTYSLFNSPWSSGLNLNHAASKDDEKSNSKMTGSKEMGGFFQPGLQSLWSVPGPSPLEWLLEQQKQKKDPAPH